jgi:excisionase family DNA binding protein
VSRRNGTQRAAPEQLELFPPTRYLTIEEVAELMHVPKSFIYRRTCRGHADPIPSYRFGGHLRFRLDEIERWIEDHRVVHEEAPAISDMPVRRSAAANRVRRRGTRQLRRQTNSVKSRAP